MQKKTIIASQDERLRHALEFLFNSEPEALVAGSSKSSMELLDLARHTKPDLVLLDWDLTPTNPGQDLIAALRKINPKTKTIVLSSLGSVMKACASGADVCIAKGSQPDAILKNFRTLFQI